MPTAHGRGASVIGKINDSVFAFVGNGVNGGRFVEKAGTGATPKEGVAWRQDAFNPSVINRWLVSGFEPLSMKL